MAGQAGYTSPQLATCLIVGAIRPGKHEGLNFRVWLAHASRACCLSMLTVPESPGRAFSWAMVTHPFSEVLHDMRRQEQLCPNSVTQAPS